jgi:N-methylhydantoinase A
MGYKPVVKNRVVGVDVGGTFTDFLVLEKGYLSTFKTLSTPADPSQAVIDGLQELGVLGAAPVVHGSTVATNALLEKRGARTALITTQGFEDILEIGRQARPAIYDLLQEKAQPIVDRKLSFAAPERVDHHGIVVMPLSVEDANIVARKVQESGAEAVAISLLFSFRNPIHEEELRDLIEALPSKPFVSISSQVLPEFREYERTSTVAVNSYVGPVMSQYMEKLESKLGNKGLRIMQSSGGSISARQASQQPVRTILSGPAGGVVGAFWEAVQAGYPEVITLDMGGTSTDVSLCPGRIQETTTATTGGYPISVPMIDIHTVGAGGGSIARVDAGGALQVGPQSAGADPGPACYGKGSEVTVTDANLLLGRLAAPHFLGGRMALDITRAQEAMGVLASSLESDLSSTALGVLRVVNSSMERAIRVVSLERGFDPRDFTMVAFGGAGPMHACELAQELHIPRVLIPLHPGILSALGVAIADVVKDYARTVMLPGHTLTHEMLDQLFHPLETHAREEIAKEGFTLERLTLQRVLDVRYVGQSYEIPIPCPSEATQLVQETMAKNFHEAHKQRFGYSDTTQKVEVVNVRLKAIGLVEKPLMPTISDKGGTRIVGHTNTSFGHANYPQTPIYQRSSLRCGDEFTGPAVIAQMDATTVVPPLWQAKLDERGNLLIEYS